MPETNQDIHQNTEKLRAEAALLLAQARQQYFGIQRALGAADGNSALRSGLAAAAAGISGVEGELSNALNSRFFALSQADLAALETAVHSGETGTLMAEAAAQAASATIARNLATTSAATRQEVQTDAHDIFEKHIFDPYLHFTSPADEAAFRKREAAARKYVDDQLARGTPEGNLNAAGGMQGEMLDANAHGAGDSPQFMPRWNALAEDTQRQRAAMHAAGQSTQVYDRNITASVRSFLKAKGLSDAEIDKRLAGSANPLDAVKPFLGDDHASRSLEGQVERAVPPAATSKSLPRVEASADAPATDTPLVINLDAMNAKLQAAGVQVTDNVEATGHGLTIQKSAGKTGLDVGN